MNVQHSGRTGPTDFAAVVREPDPDSTSFAEDYSRPSVQLYDTATHSVTLFLTVAEVDRLITALASKRDELSNADARWTEEVVRRKREQDMVEAANDGYLDNYDPAIDAPGADDYLADVTS